MTVQMTRRQFFKLTGVGVASTGIAALGFETVTIKLI
jgi:hypothetical protein